MVSEISGIRGRWPDLVDANAACAAKERGGVMMTGNLKTDIEHLRDLNRLRAELAAVEEAIDPDFRIPGSASEGVRLLVAEIERAVGQFEDCDRENVRLREALSPAWSEDGLPEPREDILWWHEKHQRWYSGALYVEPRGKWFRSFEAIWYLEYPGVPSGAIDGPTWWMLIPPDPPKREEG